DTPVAVIFQELTGVFAALADALTLVAEPCTGFFDDVLGDGQIEQVAFFRNTFSVQDVEFGLTERCGNFILHDLHFGARANHLVAVFDGGNAANVGTDGSIELQRATTGGGFGIAEHDADLLANLVDEDEAGARLGNDAGELA